MLEIELRKLSINWNGHNISLGGPIQAHNISRRANLNYGSSREIQMVITFRSEVLFRSIIYRDARNWTTEALKNSNGDNFSLGCPIQMHNISRRPKLNNGSSREIQMVITFNSDFRFRRIIYPDARNWNGHNFSLGGPIQVHNISRCSKLNYGSSREIQMVITFNM